MPVDAGAITRIPTLASAPSQVPVQKHGPNSIRLNPTPLQLRALGVTLRSVRQRDLDIHGFQLIS